MINIFACAKQLHCRIHNCQAVTDGVGSNHLAVGLKLAHTLLKHTSPTALNHGTTDWRKIITNKATNTRYNNLLPAATDDESMPYEDFNKEIKKVGKETPLLVKSKGNDWFLFNQDYLAPLIDERNQLIHALCSSADLPASIINAMHDALTHFNKNVKDKVLIANARWAAHLCSKTHDMVMNPRIVWEHIHILTGSSTAHHKKVSHNGHENSGWQHCYQCKKTCLSLDPTSSKCSTTTILLTPPSLTNCPMPSAPQA
jgi:hypothetical protein